MSPVRLINEKEEQVGVVSTNDALRMAREAGLDLVEVAPNVRPPVCRIMDFGKWKYQQQKKEHKSTTHRAGQLKELKMKTVKIGDNDLKIKINHAREFLKEGNKVQFTLQFRGREMAHLDLGHQIFRKIKEELFMFAKIERDTKMEGKRMTLVLQPENKAGVKEKEAKVNAATSASTAAPAMKTQFAGAGTGSSLNIPQRPAQAATVAKAGS